MTMAITITESAAKHVASQLSRRGKGIGLRLGVRTSGCSGLAYKIEFADERKPEDIAFEAHGVTVVVDPKTQEEYIFVRRGLYDQLRALVSEDRVIVTAEMVDRIIVIENGKLVADGPRENVVQALQQGRIGKAQ